MYKLIITIYELIDSKLWALISKLHHTNKELVHGIVSGAYRDKKRGLSPREKRWDFREIEAKFKKVR